MRGALDFTLRVAYFAFAPLLVVLAAALFPVTGALVQVGLAAIVFFAGEAARRIAERYKLARLALSTQLAFEAYYRAHPPRPFLYYVFYPLLFPYWLVVREARREFLLFKGYTLASFALLLVSLAVQYFRAFPPDLGLREFIPIAIATLVVEAIVVLMFLMPIVTSVVHYHLLGAPRRLAALLVVGVVSAAAAVVILERPRDPIVSIAAKRRVRLRTKAKPALAKKAQHQALIAAWATLPTARADVESDGKVEGVSLEHARDQLASFYKTDESYAFDLWYTKKGSRAVMVVYFEGSRSDAPIWLASDNHGAFITDPKQLPKGAFVAMKHAADAL